MKNLIYFLILIPFLLTAQDNKEYLVFENLMITPNPEKITEFHAGIKAHNEKYHSKSPYGVRMYWISNGPNTSNYVMAMGPLPWSAMDGRDQMEGHDNDWRTNVAPYTLTGSNQTYWKYNAEQSHFPKNFTVNKLLVDIYNIKRGKWEDALKLVGKVKKVFEEKMPDQIYGVYTNEFPSTGEGRDLAVISFFEDSGWLGKDREFAKKYDEVHGEDSFTHFIQDWMALTDGGETELWIYVPEISGIDGEVNVAERQ